MSQFPWMALVSPQYLLSDLGQLASHCGIEPGFQWVRPVTPALMAF